MSRLFSAPESKLLAPHALQVLAASNAIIPQVSDLGKSAEGTEGLPHLLAISLVRARSAWQKHIRWPLAFCFAFSFLRLRVFPSILQFTACQSSSQRLHQQARPMQRSLSEELGAVRQHDQ